MTKKPNLLREGDKIGIVATARKISIEELVASIKLFKSWGIEPIIGNSIGLENDQFAGSDQERARDMQNFLDNKNIKAIFCARGGYGTVRIIDKLDFTKFSQNPKWIIGYSDPTVLLSHIYYKYNIESIHGIMPVNIIEEEFSCDAIISLRTILFEGSNRIISKPQNTNRKGRAEGDLIGGNLSVLYSLLGSKSFGDTKDKILLIEDLDEYLYHIDRMMQGLDRAGKLKDIRGLIVGGLCDMNDNTVPFGKSAQEIVLETIEKYNFPVAFNIPIGHIGGRNHACLIGRKTSLIIGDDSIIIDQ